MRNWLLNRPPLMAMMLKTAEDRSTDIDLPDYRFSAVSGPS
ncbi:hypothetical protein [Dactylosporangium cerinum]